MTPYWTDGLVTIYLGDATDVMPRLNPDDFGVLFGDPPYGIKYNSGWASPGGMKRSISGDADAGLRDWILDWWGDRPAICFNSWRRLCEHGAPPNMNAMLV